MSAGSAVLSPVYVACFSDVGGRERIGVVDKLRMRWSDCARVYVYVRQAALKVGAFVRR